MTKCIFEDFTYEKKDGEKKKYSLLLLNENEKYHSGIDLSLLSKEEKDEVVKLQQEYEANISPYVKKAFRTFLVEKIEKVVE